jgi:hypothetical protein
MLLLVARLLKNSVLAVFVLVTFLASQSSARADDYAYYFTGAENFGVIDLNTGGFMLRGNTGRLLDGLGVSGGNLYGDQHNGNTLYQVNPANGSLSTVGTGDISYNDFGSTTTGLYALDQTLNLYSIDPMTGAATFIGPTGLNAQHYTSLSAGGPTLYFACVCGSSPEVLYSLNTTTGAATEIGPTSTGNIGGLVFENGTLYAGVNTNTSNSIYTLNTTTGAGTFVANSGAGGFFALAPTNNGWSTTGVSNVLSVSSLTVTNNVACPTGTSGNTCFSIQQNFYVTTPNNPNIPSYWAQDAFAVRQISGGGWQVAHEYEVWSTDQNGSILSLKYCNGIPINNKCYAILGWKTWSQSSNLVTSPALELMTTISQQSGILTFAASIGSTQLTSFSTPALPVGSSIMAASTTQQFNNWPNTWEPQLMLVGYGNGEAASFCSPGDCFSLGRVSTQLLSGSWQPPGTQYPNTQFCSSSQETSSGLNWYVPTGGLQATFTTTIEYTAAEGIIFVLGTGDSRLAECQ